MLHTCTCSSIGIYIYITVVATMKPMVCFLVLLALDIGLVTIQHCNCACVPVQTVNNPPVHTQVVCQGRHLASHLDSLSVNITHLTYRVEELGDVNVSFTRFTQLESVNITWTNQQTSINLRDANTLSNFTHPHMFEGLTKLTTLTFNIPTNAIHPELFLPLPNLTTLDLTNISAFNTDEFAKVYQGSELHRKPLTTLILRRITGVLSARHDQFQFKELLPLLANSTITKLDISYNGVITFYPGLIKYLPNLEVLIMKGNGYQYTSELAALQCTTLELHMHPSLRILDISDPSDVRLEVAAYQLQGLLCVLESCFCRGFNDMCRGFIGDTPCDLLPEYSVKSLYHPRCLRTMQIPLFPPKLEEVYASNAQLGIAGKTDYTNQTVCFYTNNVKLIDYAYIRIPSEAKDLTKGLTNITIRGLEHLETAIVHNSDFAYYLQNNKLLHALPNLITIDARHTVVGIFLSKDTEGEILRKSSKLKHLILRSANVTHLPKRVFAGLYNIEDIDLSQNGIIIVSFDVAQLTNLMFVNLANNLVETLSESFLTNLNNRSNKDSMRINLVGNTLRCGCENTDFIHKLHQYKHRFVNFDQYQCNDVSMKIVMLKDVVQDDIVDICNKPSSPLLTILAPITISVVLVTVLVLIYSRKKMQEKAKEARVENVNEQEYSFDGFVAYAEGDRFWVHDQLVPQVEKNMKMSLCVHYRDFVPGHPIEEQIVNYIAASRKTILVLSENFLASNFCDFELQTAQKPAAF